MATRAVGTLAAAVLLFLAALHVYWGAGGRWATAMTVPEREGQPLFVPGPAATLAVALLLAAAAAVLTGRLGFWGGALPPWLFSAGAWTLVAVFSGRVVGDRRWFGLFKQVTGTPFAWWDTWVYVPLCAALALAALLVASSDP